MTVTARRTTTPAEARHSTVDSQRWPDVAVVPRARVRAAIAALLARRTFARLPLRVVGPDGRRIAGPRRGPDRGGDPDAPMLELRRPGAFHRRLGAGGLVGFGEAYQAGDWDAPDLPRTLAVLARDVATLIPPKLQWLRRFHGGRHPRTDENTVDGSRRNIHRHYDLSNDLFALFLDETMTYSSALFPTGEADEPVATAANLADAQRRKVDRLLDLTGVGPGARVLEIGTGWGELAIRAAQRGADVHTLTVSAAQCDLARQRVAAAGVADRVRVDLRDYRELESPEHGYDAVLSVEMIEAVGERYWPAYFSTVDRVLAPGGRFGLQAITMAHERLLATRRTYTWMHKYIFPGGLIPSVQAIEDVCRRYTRLRIHDLHAFGRHYAQTLRLWRERFTERAAQVAALGFDETFRRTWTMYLAYCEAGFAVGYLDVHHLVLGRR